MIEFSCNGQRSRVFKIITEPDKNDPEKTVVVDRIPLCELDETEGLRLSDFRNSITAISCLDLKEIFERSKLFCLSPLDLAAQILFELGRQYNMLDVARAIKAAYIAKSIEPPPVENLLDQSDQVRKRLNLLMEQDRLHKSNIRRLFDTCPDPVWPRFASDSKPVVQEHAQVLTPA